MEDEIDRGLLTENQSFPLRCFGVSERPVFVFIPSIDLEVAKRIDAGQPVTAPGVPEGFRCRKNW
jgi:hypothetical protein